MFSGLKVIFSGGLSTARIKVFTKLFVSNGGTVTTRKTTPSVFKKLTVSTPLDVDLDYIIIENKHLRLSEACKLLSCDDIPDSVKVLHCSWIEQCMSVKEKLDTTPFEVDLTQQDPIDNSATCHMEEQQSSSKLSRPLEVDGTCAPLDHCTKRPRITFETIDYTAMSFPDAEDSGNGWRVVHSIIDGRRKTVAVFKFNGPGRHGVHGVLAFDLDSTLITTKSGVLTFYVCMWLYLV